MSRRVARSAPAPQVRRTRPSALSSRRTNQALLVLLVAGFVTGLAAYAVGTGWNAWAVVAHGAVGLTVVLLSPWKSAVARPPLQRRRQGWSTSMTFAALVALTIATGVAHALGLRVLVGGVTTLQVHVAAAVITLPFVVVHARERPLPRADGPSRRDVLRAGAVGAAGVGAYALVEEASTALALPGADRRFTGSHEVGSFDPGAMPVTQWFDDRVQHIGTDVDTDAWRLVVHGREWTYRELAGFTDRLEATLDCTGGWHAAQEWEGVRVDRLLPPGTQGRSLVVRSATGYRRRLPFPEGAGLLLATRVGGQPLSPGHGFPVRLVAPGRRGFWWVKWVVAVEVDDRPWWLQSPFPLS